MLLDFIQRCRGTPVASDRDTKSLITEHDGYALVISGAELLQLPPHQIRVRKIRELLGPTDRAWQEQYLFTLEQVACFAQRFPASRGYHHAGDCGLLVHLLDVACHALRISMGEILPPGAPPEHILLNSIRWRYGVLVSALLHDLGKVASDIEVVYSMPGEDFVRWDPLQGPLPCGARYAWRHPERDVKPGALKNLHELLGPIFLPFIVSAQSSQWLQQDPELMVAMLGSISGKDSGHGVIARIVGQADRLSVRTALGSSKPTGRSRSVAPLHERLINQLRSLAQEGELNINARGAPLFVDSTGSYLTKSTGLSALSQSLREAGDTSVPLSEEIQARSLCDANLALRRDDGVPFWQIVITIGDWVQKLTVVRFENSVVWGETLPPMIEGTIELFEPGKPKDSKAQSEHKNQIERIDPDTERPYPRGDPSHVPITDTDAGAANESKAMMGTSVPSAKPSTKVKKQFLRDNEQLTRQSAFFRWLLDGITEHAVRVNETRALVHVLENDFAIVVPAAFQAYVDANRDHLRVTDNNRDSKWKAVQTDVKRLKLHSKSLSGEDFRTLYIDGKRKKTSVNCMVFPRETVKGLERFSANPVIRLHGF